MDEDSDGGPVKNLRPYRYVHIFVLSYRLSILNGRIRRRHAHIPDVNVRGHKSTSVISE